MPFLGTIVNFLVVFVTGFLGSLIKKNVRIVITTQVPHEGSDMSVYRVGLRIKQKYELPEAYDMTTEAALAKVMWALPQTNTAKAFKELFQTPVGNDIL